MNKRLWESPVLADCYLADLAEKVLAEGVTPDELLARMAKRASRAARERERLDNQDRLSPK